MAARKAIVSVGIGRLSRLALAATTAGMFWASPAAAWIGDSFLQVPDAKGHYKGAEHLGWIRAESSAWSSGTQHIGMGGFGGYGGGGILAPRAGTAASLFIMLSKSNPDTAILMDRCTKKAKIPEVGYAEPADRVRPAGMPAFVEYKLKDVQITDCPVLAGAIEQGFVISFQDIQWLNYTPPARTAGVMGGRPAGGQAAGGQGGARPAGGTTADQAGGGGRTIADARAADMARATVIPVVMPVEPANGKRVKDYVVTWLGVATDSTKEQCPVMSAKPTEADYFRYRTPQETAELKAKLGEKGLTQSAESEWRGPGKMNVAVLPGIIPDPVLPEPISTVAAGINLDGDDGTGKPPKGIKKHKNYTSPSGVKGVDNQLYTVLACVPGFRGKDGYRIQTDNARRADGNITTIIEVSGITDDQNDNNIEVALIHSMDKPIRDNVGAHFVGGYTFRPTLNPRFADHNVRIKGRIVNGIIETDVIPVYSVMSGQGPDYDLYQARMRIEPQPDGSVKMWLGGYLDWRTYSSYMGSGYMEGLFGYQQPAVWYAFKRNADGLYNAATGEYDGISAAYELDGVPAFMTPLSPTGTPTAAK